MSAFLGPIHYWLYNKVLWHEELLQDIITNAKEKDSSIEVGLVQIYAQFGAPDFSPLETAINHGNIHGWLQTRIQSVEYRIAAVITQLLSEGKINIEELVTIYSDNAKKAAKTITSEGATPQDLFKLVFDFMLEGMPCDRVNEILSDTETELTWETTSCLHTAFWNAVKGDVSNFYQLQEAWIGSFVHAVDEAYIYTKQTNGLKSIEKR